jgi:hypothetical protein
LVGQSKKGMNESHLDPLCKVCSIGCDIKLHTRKSRKGKLKSFNERGKCHVNLPHKTSTYSYTNYLKINSNLFSKKSFHASNFLALNDLHKIYAKRITER